MKSITFLSPTFTLVIILTLTLCFSSAQNCNDIRNENVKVAIKTSNKSYVDISRERINLLLDGATDAEVRYRIEGDQNWINAPGNVNWVAVPLIIPPTLAIWGFDGDFTLSTKFGNVPYEYQTRIYCSGSEWGSWLTKFFKSYCGNEGFDNMPTDIDAEELTFMNEYATEGRLSADGGKTFFRIDDYQNNSLVFSGLHTNTDYWFKCRARCQDNMWSPFSVLSHVKTKCRVANSNETSIYAVNNGTQIGMSCSRESDFYEFHRRLKGNNSWTSSGSITQDHYTFPQQVDKGDIYEFQLRQQCGGQWTDWSSIEEYSIPVQCPQPITGEIGVNNITDHTAHLFCKSGHSTGVIEKHHFRVRENAGSNWIEKTSDNKEIDFANLNNNTEYVMQVQHECTNGVTGNWSPMIFFTTDQGCVISSTSISIQDIDYTGALLKCKQMNRDGYTWEVTRVRDGKMINIPNNLPDPTYQLDNLEQAEDYEVRLKIHCGTEVSEFSDIQTFTCLGCPSANESQIAVLDIGNTSANLNYYGNISQGLHWQYRQVGNSGWRSIYSNSESTLLDSLVKNAMYEYRLRIQCADQPDVYSEWSSIKTFQTACLAMVNRFSNITINSITVHANDANADTYDFRYRQAGNNNWIMINAGSQNSINISMLESMTEYEVQVRGVCNNLPGIWSATESVSTKDERTPPCNSLRRSEINITNISTYSANLNCSRDADFYFFRYRMTNGGNWIETPALTTNSYLASNLLEDTRYDVQSKVQCGMSVTEWSDTIRFRTEELVFGLSAGCPAPFPSDYIATGIGAQVAALTCLKSADQFGFRYRERNTSLWIELSFQSSNRFNINGLKGNTEYEYQCRIECNGVPGLYSASKFFTTLNPLACEAPRPEDIGVLKIQSYEATALILELGLKYQIRYKPLDEELWIYSDTLNTPVFKLSELKAGQEYAYQIRRMCLNNEFSPFSNVKNFQTLPICESSNLAALRVDSLSANAALVSDRGINTKAYYYFRYRELGTREWNFVLGLADYKRFALFSNLKEATEYEFQVLGLCSEKSISNWSASKTFKTLKGTSVDDPELSGIMVYPNPASSYLILKNDLNSDSLDWQIQDLNGKVQLSGKLPASSEQKINIKLSPGIYLLHGINDKLKLSKKLMIE